MQNLIFKGLNGQFKILAAAQYITRIKDSTNEKLDQGRQMQDVSPCLTPLVVWNNQWNSD